MCRCASRERLIRVLVLKKLIISCDFQVQNWWQNYFPHLKSRLRVSIPNYHLTLIQYFNTVLTNYLSRIINNNNNNNYNSWTHQNTESTTLFAQDKFLSLLPVVAVSAYQVVPKMEKKMYIIYIPDIREQNFCQTAQ